MHPPLSCSASPRFLPRALRLALFPLLWVTAAALLGGCADEVEQCTARKQAEYRKKNPTTRYAVASTANERFRRECQLFQSRKADGSGPPQPNVRQLPPEP